MHFQILNRIEQLQRYRAEWSGLAVESPFTSPEWMIRWAEVYLAGRGAGELYTFAALDDAGRLIGLAPWYRRRGWRTRRRVLEFLGSGEVCSDHLSLLAAPGRHEQFATALADFLASDGVRAQWEGIDLQGVDADNATMNLFVDRCRERALGSISVRTATPSYWTPLPDSWDEWLAACSKNRRKRLRRWQRAYCDSGRVEQTVVENAQQLPNVFSALVQLHNRRRRGLGQSGAFEDAGFLQFHRAVLPELLQSGQLRMSLVALDGQPVAAEYLLTSGDTWLAYQSGLEPDAIEHGPGNLSLMLTIQAAIRQGIRELDFLRGDEDYKLAWGCRRRNAHRIRIRRTDLTGRIEHWADRLKEIRSSVTETQTAHSIADRVSSEPASAGGITGWLPSLVVPKERQRDAGGASRR